MKWLLITTTSEESKKIEEVLSAQDKKNKLFVCDYDEKNIIAQKKNFKELAGCVLLINKNNKLSESELSLLSSLSGYFAFDKIPLYTNAGFILDSSLFNKDGIAAIENADDFCNIITKKYKKLTQTSVERLAKNKLLKRGIPFTSDCFGTYIAKNKIEIFNEFLEAGMDVNVRDDSGTPMLNIACRNDNYEFVEMLINLGAEINAASEDRGYTAVMDAIWRGNEKITKYLISKGADLNTINKEGQTNLILAVGADKINLVQILAENGADPDVKDQMGMSAYNYATLFKKEKIAEILKPFHKEN